MKAILLPIKPKYAYKIISGEKQFEFRTKVPAQAFEKIYIYASAPDKKIIGEVTVAEIIKKNPNELWEATKAFSGIAKDKFFEYFKNREYGYAYRLKDVVVYDHPRMLSDFGLSSAPQSFEYVE